MSPIKIPDLGYASLAPMLAVFAAAVLGVLVEAFVPRRARFTTQVTLGIAGLLAALIFLVRMAGEHAVVAAGAIAVDGPTQFIQGVILIVALLSLLLFAERDLEPGGPFVAQAAAVPGSAAERNLPTQGNSGQALSHTEVFPLLLFAVGGMMLLPAANDLLTLFVALEVLSLPLYLLCGMARRRRLLSQESAVKYFLLGSLSSAILLYGIAMVYGFAGTVSFGPHLHADGTLAANGIAEAVSLSTSNETLLWAGLALMLIGLLFKIGAVPFHMWTPDVYTGAPTAVTAFMAAGTKIAAFGALMRVMYVIFGGLRWDWMPLLWGVAILTMVVGSILALTQTDVKRMLAYSSIAHAGFLLVGLAATDANGVSSVLFYLLTYALISIGAFALLTMVRTASGETASLSAWAGLGRRSPLVAGLMGLFLLALAGIPLTSGFAGKLAVFSAAVKADATPLVLVAVAASAIAAFFYLRVIVMMFFAGGLIWSRKSVAEQSETTAAASPTEQLADSAGGPTAAGATVPVAGTARTPVGVGAAVVVSPSVFTVVVVAVTAAATVILGVAPQVVFDLTDKAVGFLR